MRSRFVLYSVPLRSTRLISSTSVRWWLPDASGQPCVYTARRGVSPTSSAWDRRREEGVVGCGRGHEGVERCGGEGWYLSRGGVSGDVGVGARVVFGWCLLWAI